MLVNDNEESRRMVENCYKRSKVSINPIIDWRNSDVWMFIKENNIPYCKLYDEGWSRLGCIGCPMAQTKERERQLMRYPKYKAAYLRAFDKMLKEKERKGNPWKKGISDGQKATAMDVFNWWMEYDILPGQMDLFEEDTE